MVVVSEAPEPDGHGEKETLEDLAPPFA
jgi:hypothetical protein